MKTKLELLPAAGGPPLAHDLEGGGPAPAHDLEVGGPAPAGAQASTFDLWGVIQFLRALRTLYRMV